MVVLIMPRMAFCQLTNYDENGKKISFFSEKDSISVTKISVEKQSVVSLLLGAIGPAIGVGIDVARTVFEKREESYTATYSAYYTGSGFYADNKFTLERIKLYRLTKRDENAKQDTASKIVLLFVANANDPGMFRLKVDNISLTNSKARIRKHGENGKTIDISINVKIDASWRDYSVDKDNKNNVLYSIKSSSLGESSIIVTGLKPGKPKVFGNDNSLYSNWFQSIPNFLPNDLGTSDRASEERNRGWYTITVTIKEANPYGVSSNTLNSFLKNNGTDVSTFLKSFVPSSSSSSEKK